MIIQPAMESSSLTDLERSVLMAALSAPGTDARFFRQIDTATVALRTPSGVGFMTKFSVPEEYRVEGMAAGSIGPAAAIPVLPPVTGSHPALPAGAEFILQVRNGYIHCLEGYCHEGMWPSDESLFSIYAESGFGS